MMLQLGNKNALNAPQVPIGPRTLSLDKWLPWQNRLQETHLISHSADSVNLVDILEFCSIQGFKFVCDISAAVLRVFRT